MRSFSSSRQWFVKQVKDPYVKAAREANYRSRAAFKLLQLHHKYQIFENAQLVVDLGAAPGGWSQIAAQHVLKNNGLVVAIDIIGFPCMYYGTLILGMDPLDGVSFFQGDFTLQESSDKVKEICGNNPDVILSDMAPNLSGNHDQDHIRSIHLVRSAYEFAKNELVIGGKFVAKVFQGRYLKALEKAMGTLFGQVCLSKPSASRKESAELYIIGIGRKGTKTTCGKINEK